MLPEAVLRAYRKAKEDYEKMDTREGFQDIEWKNAAKKTMDILWALFLLVLTFFLFILVPLAIYYIIVCGQKNGWNKALMVFMIILLFLPEFGFLFALIMVIYGYTMSCGSNSSVSYQNYQPLGNNIRH